MSAPTSYTESTLKAFMIDAVGNLATVLDLSDADFDEAVNETLLVYGVTQVEDATDVRKLRALARVEAWRVAVRQSAGYYNFTSANARYERKAIHDQAVATLAEVRHEAAAYAPLDAPRVEVTPVRYASDPYLDASEEQE